MSIYFSSENTANGAFNSAVDEIRNMLAQTGWQPSKELGKASLRLENFSNANEASTVMSAGRGSVQRQLDTLYQAFARATPSVSLDQSGREITSSFRQKFVPRQEAEVKKYAFEGFAMANDPKAWGSRSLAEPNLTSSKARIVTRMEGGRSGGMNTLAQSMRARLEAFRDIDLHATTAYSMGYGASITRQTDFVMGWYPPILLEPSKTALEVDLTLLTVFNGAEHDAKTGDLTKFNRRNVARALENPEVLNRHETLAKPIWRDTNKHHFVDEATIAPKVKSYGSRKIKTSFLKFDDSFSILGLSTTDRLLQTNGAPTHRESLEPGAKLESVLVKCGDDLVEIPTLGLRTLNFIAPQQGDQQETQMVGNVTLGLSGLKLKKENGQDLTGPLKLLVDNKLRISVQMRIHGTLNVESSNMHVSRPAFALKGVESTDTNQVFTSTDSTWQQVEAALKQIEPLGFQSIQYKTNSTKREQGDRVTSRNFKFVYMAPYRDPITVERMVGTQGDHEAQDLTNLMGLIKIRIENEAIDHMFEMFDLMRTYVDMNENDATTNDLPGLAQFYLINVFHEETLDLSKFIDSTKSHERAEDIQAFLVMKLRDISTRLLTFMQWKAAMIMQNNDTMPPPQINIVTDPIIARYLLAPGDLRTLGEYDFVVTTTLNRRMKGKLAMSFRVPGQEASNKPEIFGWGHLLTSPEIVFAANMIRNGDYFSELQVQPRYEFIPMNLSGALFTITGLPEVLGKIEGYSRLKGPLNAEGELLVKQVP